MTKSHSFLRSLRLGAILTLVTSLFLVGSGLLPGSLRAAGAAPLRAVPGHSVGVPAGGSAALRVRGIALEPGAPIQPGNFAPAPEPLASELVRTTLYYGINWGYTDTDPKQVALAVWWARDGAWREPDHTVAERIASAASSAPGSPSWNPDGRSLLTLASQGRLSIGELNMEANSDLPSLGEGTLVLHNTSAQDVLAYLPYGAVFRGDGGDVLVWAVGVGEAQPTPEPTATEEVAGQTPTATASPTDTPLPSPTPTQAKKQDITPVGTGETPTPERKPRRTTATPLPPKATAIPTQEPTHTSTPLPTDTATPLPTVAPTNTPLPQASDTPAPPPPTATSAATAKATQPPATPTESVAKGAPATPVAAAKQPEGANVVAPVAAKAQPEVVAESAPGAAKQPGEKSQTNAAPAAPDEGQPQVAEESQAQAAPQKGSVEAGPQIASQGLAGPLPPTPQAMPVREKAEDKGNSRAGSVAGSNAGSGSNTLAPQPVSTTESVEELGAPSGQIPPPVGTGVPEPGSGTLPSLPVPQQTIVLPVPQGTAILPVPRIEPTTTPVPNNPNPVVPTVAPTAPSQVGADNPIGDVSNNGNGEAPGEVKEEPSAVPVPPPTNQDTEGGGGPVINVGPDNSQSEDAAGGAGSPAPPDGGVAPIESATNPANPRPTTSPVTGGGQSALTIWLSLSSIMMVLGGWALRRRANGGTRPLAPLSIPKEEA